MNDTPTFRIRLADSGDLAACLDLRIDSEQASVDGLAPSHDHDRQALTHWIQQGAMYVVTNHIWDVVACFALAGADTEIWTAAEAAQPALYLYEFTVAADCLDTGLDDVILDWCARRAEAAGAMWLRLDCWRAATALHDLWTRRGFVHLDTRDHPGRDSGVLFQRDASTQLASAELRTTITLLDDTVATDENVRGSARAGTAQHTPSHQGSQRFADLSPVERAEREIAETKDDLMAARELAPDDDTFAARARMLEERLPRLEVRLAELRKSSRGYDSTDEAAVWLAAAEVVLGMRLDEPPVAATDSWNAALEQAARTLQDRAGAIRSSTGKHHGIGVDGRE
jgi:hypothetical protein